MTTKAQRLRQEALTACWRHAHNMSPFSWKRRTNGVSAISRCETCGAEAYIDTNPAPNGIDVGGSAVAVNCT